MTSYLPISGVVLDCPQGHEAIEELIREGELRFVVRSVSRAQVLLTEARRHLTSAFVISDADPVGGYLLAYGAVGRAFDAVLEAKGLCVVHRLYRQDVRWDAVEAQFGDQFGGVLRPYVAIRVRRRELDNRKPDARTVSTRDVESALVKVGMIVELVDRLIPQFGPYS